MQLLQSGQERATKVFALSLYQTVAATNPTFFWPENANTNKLIVSTSSEYMLNDVRCGSGVWNDKALERFRFYKARLPSECTSHILIASEQTYVKEILLCRPTRTKINTQLIKDSQLVYAGTHCPYDSCLKTDTLLEPSAPL